MVAGRNPVTGSMGTEPEFVCTDSGVVSEPKTLSRKDIEKNNASACQYLTNGISVHFSSLRQLLMYSLLIHYVNA